eukprot:4302436-Heterocapsa_arctica.AAC.1
MRCPATPSRCSGAAPPWPCLRRSASSSRAPRSVVPSVICLCSAAAQQRLHGEAAQRFRDLASARRRLRAERLRGLRDAVAWRL